MKNLYRKKLSLTDLFGDFVTTCEGKEVSTSGKTVGLYFYEESYSGIERTRKLKRNWESLECRPDIDFEILLNYSLTLNQSSAKAKFKEEFGNIPWYTLLGSGRKLCSQNCRASLAELRFHVLFLSLNPDRSLNYFAFDMYNVLGLDAYPFSLENTMKFMTSNLERTLELDKLLFYLQRALPAIAAFGPSGQLLAKESNLAFKELSYSCEEEVRREFVGGYKCDME